MIVGSLLILVGAAGLLVTGLMNRNDTFLIGSIVASVIAAIGLYLGARAAGRRAAEEDEDVDEARYDEDEAPARNTGRERYEDHADDLDEVERVEQPRRSPAVSFDVGGPDEEPRPDVEFEDEPAPMSITRIDRTRLSGLTVPVQVVDGRPRYHLAGCVHLLGKEDEPLAVNEAVELGFTPCGLCEPTADVLADLSVRSGH